MSQHIICTHYGHSVIVQAEQLEKASALVKCRFTDTRSMGEIQTERL